MIPFFLGQHHSPSSSGPSKLARSSDFSPSGSLSHDEPWSSSSSMLLVHPVWTVHSDIALALRNNSNIGFRSCLCFCLSLSLFLLSLSPFQSSLLPLEPSFCLLPFLRYLFRHSSIHQLLFHDATSLIRSVPAPLAALYPFQEIAHTSSYDMSLLVSESLCIARTNVSQVHWFRSVVGYHFVDGDLHDFVELSRSRQKLTFDVLRHHLPHHEYLLCFIDHFELMQRT